ncbi:MAG: CPBP family intramembrane glutamic endopeptidase [Conexivisphaerales archaeon]
MKQREEVLIYTAITLVSIGFVNIKSFNTILNAYAAYLLVLIILPLYLLKRSGASLLTAFGIERKRLSYLYLFLLIMIGVSSMLVYRPSLYPVAIFSFVLAPVAEETSFRGYIVTRLKPSGKMLAVVYSGAAFGLAHFFVDTSFEAAALRFVLGILLAYIFVVSGKLLAAISLHVVFNVYTILHVYSSIQSYIALLCSFLLVVLALYEYYSARRT